MANSEPNESNEVAAQYLKTGDIIAIKGEPLVVENVVRVTGSVSVEILFMNGFKHLTPKSTRFKVIARETNPLLYRTAGDGTDYVSVPGGPLVINPDLNLCAYFVLSLDEIESAPQGYRRNDRIVQLALWILDHKDKVFFGDKVELPTP